jgi:hypothetical protein
MAAAAANNETGPEKKNKTSSRLNNYRLYAAEPIYENPLKEKENYEPQTTQSKLATTKITFDLFLFYFI